ncbi:MAG: PT domain-containing protein [Clostridiales bacterium]
MKKIIMLVLMVSLVFVLVSCDDTEVDKSLDKADDILSKNVDKLVDAENNKEDSTETPVEEPKEDPTEEPKEDPTEEPKVDPTEEPKVDPTEEPTVKPVVETMEIELMLINNNGDINNLYLGDSKGSSEDMKPGETKTVKVSLEANESKIEDSLVVNCEKDGKVISTKEVKIVEQYVEDKPILAIWDGSEFAVSY